jgi:hypothetical protein
MAVGAFSVEAPIQLLQMQWFNESKIGGFFVKRPHWLYASSGALVALLIQAVPKKWASEGTKQRAAIAVASAGAGAGYLNWRMAGGALPGMAPTTAPVEAVVEGAETIGALTLGALTLGQLELGALELGAVNSYGEGPAYTVSPMGGGSLGAVILGG